MATKSGSPQGKPTQKILRVGIIQNGRIIEERLLRNRESVSVGQKLKNTFVIASSEFPATCSLFEVKSGKYVLQVTDKMNGRLSLGDSVYDLEALKKSGKAKRGGAGWQIDLDDRSRGKVVLGDVTILFQFVNPPPLRVLPQLPANMRGGLLLFIGSIMGLTPGFLISLMMSILVQVGGVVYLVFWVPPPPRTTSIDQIPDRFIAIVAEPEEPEEPPEVDTEDGEVSEDGDVVAEEEVAEETEDDGSEQDSEPVEQQEVSRQPNRSEDQIREAAQERVRSESALAAFYGGEDGEANLGVSFTDSLTSRRAEETLARQQAIGEGGGSGGIVASTGLSTSAGAEGEVGRAQVDTGGSSLTGEATVEETEERETVEVRASVRTGDSATAGTGRLDQSSLQRVLRRRRRDVQRCYERGLAQNPELSGRVVVQFTINDAGRVDDVRLRENELGSSVGNCITGAVRRWRFDAPEGGSVTVRTPYIFSASSD